MWIVQSLQILQQLKKQYNSTVAKFATVQKNIDRNSKSIRKHIDNALKEDLDKEVVVANFATTAN